MATPWLVRTIILGDEIWDIDALLIFLTDRQIAVTALTMIRAFPAALAVVLPLIAGCPQSDGPLIADNGKAFMPDLATAFAKACTSNGCTYWWASRDIQRRLLVGMVAYHGTDPQSFAFLPLGNGGQLVGQLTEKGEGRTSYYQYVLLRPHGDGYFLYDVSLSLLDARYLDTLVEDGHLLVKSHTTFKQYRIANRVGLQRLFTDLARLDDDTLARVAEFQEVKLVSVDDVRQDVLASEIRGARLDLE